MNLKRIHEARGDFRSLLLVCDRLVDLTDAPEHRRDRGVAAYHLGSFQAASDDLFAYVDHCADAPDAWQVAAAAERARSRSTSNLQ
jgi:regulator of sirC expression with transglutaminase-like and TPR domain